MAAKNTKHARSIILNGCEGSLCISLKILKFLNRCISVKTSLINTKLGDFVNLGVLFLTMWISSCYPIIYRLVPSPSRFEIRQWRLSLLLVLPMLCFLYMIDINRHVKLFLGSIMQCSSYFFLARGHVIFQGGCTK